MTKDAMTTADLEKVAKLHKALGEPVMLPAVIADFVDMTGVSERKIATMVRYGHIIGTFVPAFAAVEGGG